jgi:mRNA-degrading endonuclease toxin of MazEF toxin-antitoxin module
MPPTSTTYSFADVLLVSFLFTDQSERKNRPAVIISSEAYNRERSDLILMALTSHIRIPRGFGEVVLTEWRQAGLHVPCVTKPVLFTFEKHAVGRKLGRLHEKDRTALRTILGEILGG